MYVRDPLRVVVAGPLSSHVDGFCAALGRLGYSPAGAAELVQLTAHLSRWLDERGLVAGELTSEVVESFLVDRRQQYRKRRSGQALGPLLGYLRSVGAAPEQAGNADGGELALLVDRYRRYLVLERGLSDLSVRRYLLTAGRFLDEVPAPIEVGLRQLSAGQVVEFVTGQVGRRSVADAKCMVTALRSLLRFLFIDGWVWPDLALAVPTVANRKLASLPKRLPAGQMAWLLTSCDRSTAVGRRDFAILTLLSRLGLRAGEIAAIELGDVNWRTAELTVRGKGDRRDQLPLPADVGQAVVDYLQHGRPAGCATTSLFVRDRAPRQAIAGCGVRAVVARACSRAGVTRIGAHRLRHTLASDLLAAGASLAEIGQVLRHRSQLSTAIYAKVDRDRLRALARPWPVAGAR
jgi:site-specific recombinase XerD